MSTRHKHVASGYISSPSRTPQATPQSSPHPGIRLLGHARKPSRGNAGLIPHAPAAHARGRSISVGRNALSDLFVAAREDQLAPIRHAIDAWTRSGGKHPNPLKLQDRTGRSLLMIAAAQNHKDLAHLLLEAKASIDDTDSTGITALSIAARLNSQEVASLLLAHGAGLHVLDEFGSSALDYAMHHNHVDMVATLASHGATISDAMRDSSPAVIQAALRRGQQAFLLDKERLHSKQQEESKHASRQARRRRSAVGASTDHSEYMQTVRQEKELMRHTSCACGLLTRGECPYFTTPAVSGVRSAPKKTAQSPFRFSLTTPSLIAQTEQLRTRSHDGDGGRTTKSTFLSP